jgi:hypothetical protein
MLAGGTVGFSTSKVFVVLYQVLEAIFNQRKSNSYSDVIWVDNYRSLDSQSIDFLFVFLKDSAEDSFLYIFW